MEMEFFRHTEASRFHCRHTNTTTNVTGSSSDGRKGTQDGNLHLHQFSSVAQSCPTLCDPVNCSTPGLPVHHQLPESTQTHVH